jgi:hypothetical protein
LTGIKLDELVKRHILLITQRVNEPHVVR